ncbi:MAG: valine--tRNA ligase [Candidatus Saccharimonadales bacterium]
MKLSKAYSPSEHEKHIYELWEKSGAFKADPTSDKPRFSISMPPPNETGTLSLGHAMYTLQDIMIRHARQQGKDALWLPGTDHAALAVNAIIEKKLVDEGKTKHDIGRDDFLVRTKAFVGDSRDTMLLQMRAMGFSADWSRLRYTLDDSLNRMVNETFVRMYQKGLIYRGHRIVNWDPTLETNVSDDELEHVEETTSFYTFQYGPFQIGTARPETKFGDKYVVMHPKDRRYAKYKHGDSFEAEWINGPVRATVIKDEAIDMDFGTGVMTITPWHDHTDFDIAERHNLDKEQIIDLKGKLLPVAQEFAGMPIESARPKIVEKLRQKGLLVREDKNYVHKVAVNGRGKAKIEPQIRLQWFVDVNKPAVKWQGREQSFKQVLRDVVDGGDIKITPKRFEKTYYHWIDNLRDWCISRQIWWGHRIPVWYRTNANDQTETYVGLQPPANDETEGWHEWEQDPDTLDTWFSSALWTWSTLVDQQKAADFSLSFEQLLAASPDYQAYHPTSVMETGWDILFFWVARMILATTFMTGQIPFKDVYLHGMVRAEDGKKMSKSRPESIVNPLDIIAKYGTDALRLSLIWGTSPGQDFSWSTPKLESTRNFCNKLWNVARYIDEITDGKQVGVPEPKTVADNWILSKLQHLTDVVANDLESFRFSEAFDKVYHGIWDDFADWYIEASKVEPNPAVLKFGLETILKLAHPFAPFVTEAIYQQVFEGDGLLITAPWPKVPAADKSAAKDFEEVKVIVSEIRNLVTELKLSKPRVDFGESKLIEANARLIERLSRAGPVRPTGQSGGEVRLSDEGKGYRLTQTKQPVWLDIDEAKLQAYAKELQSREEGIDQTIKNLEGRLANKDYVQSAPEAIVAQTKHQLEEARQQAAKLRAEIARFS